MANNPTTKGRAGHEHPAGDVAAATALLGENSTLLTGRTPVESQWLPGRSHVHRMSLYWPPRAPGCPAVCLQVLPVSTGAATGSDGSVPHGWSNAEAEAIAESLDLRLHEETTEQAFGSFLAWRRAAGPSYYLALVDQSDPPVDRATLDQRCAALEAGYLDGVAWMRFYSARQFAEGSFSRLLQHLAHEVRGPGTTDPAPSTPTTTPHGIC